MKKPHLFFFAIIIVLVSQQSFAQAVIAGRQGEVFLRTDLVGSATAIGSTTQLQDPWEITYGPDDSLWVTEAKGYTVRKINPTTGGMRTVLDLTEASTFTPGTYRRTFTSSQSPWPQGGMMGLAIHPEFMTNPAKKFVYVAYVHNYVGSDFTYGTEPIVGPLFFTWIVRFTYTNGQLVSPKVVCDTLRGSNDHNSGRMIIAPVGNSEYLFYALGDQGGGQFGNINKTNKAQNPKSYEGKILRFNLEEDNDAGAYDKWIPSGTSTPDSTNPFNTTSPAYQSAVWSTGIRNNQGFAFARINNTDILYGTSHGPFSDDELNIIEKQKNYGHPLVVGKNDGNYNGARAGQIKWPWPSGTASTLPVIGNENTNVNAINALITDSYRDPIYCFYDTIAGNTGITNSIQYIYNNTSNAYLANDTWASEAISGLGIYTDSRIPDWKNTLFFASLKKGRILRMKLNAAGTAIVATNGKDTVSNFNSKNKFRDVAFDTTGKNLFTCIDLSPTTSGPGASNPIVSDCGGCVQKYTFLGYNSNTSTPFDSKMPTSIPIAAGVNNTVQKGNTIDVSGINLNYWVPITDTNSNVIAEVKSATALGKVYTQFYHKAPVGLNREDGFKHIYCDRNITITTTNAAAVVNIRLYITAAEFNRLVGAVNSVGAAGNISTITNLGIFRNNDLCGSYVSGPASAVATTLKNNFGGTTNAYVLQATITVAANTRNSFYFANVTNVTLPTNILTFTGALEGNAASLKWITSGEVNTANYEVERSIDGSTFTKIGSLQASGNSAAELTYNFTDAEAGSLPSQVVYYRLKMNDRDGNYSYSTVISISLNGATLRVSVLPNPASREIRVNVVAPADGRAIYKITDNAGHTVIQSTVDVKKGNNSTTINVERLAAGSYYVTISGIGIEQRVNLQKL